VISNNAFREFAEVAKGGGSEYNLKWEFFGKLLEV